ncbi:MAG: helix-turn-helix domain-containing protein [Rhodospirillales bacterium]|nr:helix-turn-helix domain-containing protein [Rhodospirillales bacterium]
MTKLSTLKRNLLKNPEVRAEYEARKPEYEIASVLIAARKKARLTQEEVAIRMGTKQATVSRLESGRHKPSFKTIEKYAEATGHRAVMKLIPV